MAGPQRGGGDRRDGKSGGRGGDKTTYLERVVFINRVSKTVKGGRRMSLVALVVVGDGKGNVGLGMGKSAEVPLAISKASLDAKKNMFHVPVTETGTIPHEVDWLRTAVHLHKGCYRGQETIARVHNLGRPPRRLVFLHLDGSGHELPAAGAPVRLGDRAVGHLTSVVRHHEDGPVALALIKRNTDPAAVLLAGADDAVVTAAQTVIVAP